MTRLNRRDALRFGAVAGVSAFGGCLDLPSGGDGADGGDRPADGDDGGDRPADGDDGGDRPADGADGGDRPAEGDDGGDRPADGTPTGEDGGAPPVTPDSYPAFQYDAGNSGYNPEATPPGGDVSVSRVGGENFVLNSPSNVAVVGDALYTGEGRVDPEPPAGDGWSDETTTGSTIPTVVGDRLYTAGGLPYGGQACVAVSRSERAVVWKSPVADYAAGHPTVADGRVFTTASSGTAYAFAVEDGAELWRADLGGGSSSVSVATDGDLAVVGGYDRLVRGLDAADGTERWRVELMEILRGTTLVDGTVFASTGRRVRAIDAASGEQRWQTGVPRQMLTSVAVAEGTVYAAPRDGTLVALDATTGETRWTVDVGEGNDASSPVVAGDTVVVGSKGARVVGVDAATGELRWSVQLPFEAGVSTPSVAGGAAYVANGGLWRIA